MKAFQHNFWSRLKLNSQKSIFKVLLTVFTMILPFIDVITDHFTVYVYLSMDFPVTKCIGVALMFNLILGPFISGTLTHIFNKMICEKYFLKCCYMEWSLINLWKNFINFHFGFGEFCLSALAGYRLSLKKFTGHMKSSRRPLNLLKFYKRKVKQY